MSWHTLNRLDEWNSIERQSFDFAGTSVLVIRLEQEFFAVENLCSHKDLPLEDGDIEDCSIVCPFHGAKFCLKTGAVETPPAVEDIRIYKLRQHQGLLQIKNN